MIVTLTPNPSVDRAVTVGALHRGHVLRAASSRVDPGGKGVNVGRALTAMGVRPLVVVPSGGPEGTLFDTLLRADGIRAEVVPIAESMRMNVSVLEPDGTTTKLNEAGPELAPGEVASLVEATLEVAAPGVWIAACGSLPPGVPTDLYATLVREAQARGARVAIDSSGVPFDAAVAAGPTLIKPNRVELSELTGRPLDTLGAVVDTARELVSTGIDCVAVSLGRDGAVLVTADSAVHATAVISDPVSTVGAGDCMLAGLLHGLDSGADLPSALGQGVRWGAAAVRLQGTAVPTPDHLIDIAVTISEDPELALPLDD
ncbi:1-phosphofructokinase [Brevibacterium sanguinis]|uniref:1-phosphofructokinase n=1 Tax=Brevibacterium sanguinis TaxID=232444 RepID=UPI0031DB45DE